MDGIKVNLDEVALVFERSSDSLEAKRDSGSYAKIWQQIAQRSFLQVPTEQIMPFSAKFLMRKTVQAIFEILFTSFFLSPELESSV